MSGNHESLFRDSREDFNTLNLETLLQIADHHDLFIINRVDRQSVIDAISSSPEASWDPRIVFFQQEDEINFDQTNIRQDSLKLVFNEATKISSWLPYMCFLERQESLKSLSVDCRIMSPINEFIDLLCHKFSNWSELSELELRFLYLNNQNVFKITSSLLLLKRLRVLKISYGQGRVEVKNADKLSERVKEQSKEFSQILLYLSVEKLNVVLDDCDISKLLTEGSFSEESEDVKKSLEREICEEVESISDSDTSSYDSIEDFDDEIQERLQIALGRDENSISVER